MTIHLIITSLFCLSNLNKVYEINIKFDSKSITVHYNGCHLTQKSIILNNRAVIPDLIRSDLIFLIEGYKEYEFYFCKKCIG